VNEDRSRFMTFFSRNHVALILLAVAIGIGLLTYWVYPENPPVTVQGAVQRITVVGPVVPSSVDVNEEPYGRDGIQLTVALRSAEPQKTSVSSERLVVAVSSRLKGACPPQAIACPSADGARTLTYRFAAQHWRTFGSAAVADYAYGVSLTVLNIPNVAANLAQDDQDIATSIPPVSVLHYVYSSSHPVPAPAYLANPPVVDYGERTVNGNAYTWQGGSTPVDTGGWEHWWYASASSAPEALSATFYSGSDLAVVDRNNNRTFLAGILVGIAGGALIGALQVAISKNSS
jgi:hypothetical protein